jgi:RNA 2',3'-cyclic 3'-phosphodiesterase
MRGVYSPSRVEGAAPARLSEPVQQARVFVGLKIAPEIAIKLAQFAAALEQSFVRPVAQTDIHLTLVPPWNENFIPEAIDKLRRVADEFRPFWLLFQHVGYGPRPTRPRLLWADCAATDDISALRTALLQVFGQVDERPFQPHVTIARIRENGSAIARKHPIDQSLAIRQRVESVQLFRSPAPSAKGYQVVASLRLAATGCSPRP